MAECDRRTALARLTCLGAAALVGPWTDAFAPSAANRRRGKIDVHHHFQPPAPQGVGGGGRAGGGGGGGGGNTAWSPAIAIEEMDRNGVATGVGFLGPLPANASVEDGRRIARQWNDFGARVVADHPGRFGLFAALPLTDVDGSLKEIEYALDTLHADGFGLSTSYGDLWLGDSKFRPIWEELHRRRAIMYVHPNDNACCTPQTLTYEKAPISGPWIEWPVNTARTIFSLVFNGVTRELPGARFIFSHSGGVMPLLVERIEGFVGWPAIGPERLKELFPNGLRTEFQKLYFEGAQGSSKTNFDALTSLVPTSHVFFGTDYNRFPMSHPVKIFEALKLSPSVRRAIERENAETLFPRLKTA